MVLCYHKVYNLENDINNVSINVESFYEQMKYLKEHFDIVSAKDYCINDTSVAITFDDGYEDNYLNAAPILHELQIPATFFISTACIDVSDEIWCHEVTNYIYNNTIDNPPLILDGKSYNVDNDRKKINFELMDKLRKTPIEHRLELISEIKKWAGVKLNPRKEYRMLNSVQIKNLSSDELFTIGAHTINHPSIGHMDYIEQEREIVTSKNVLEKIIGSSVDLFAYPFGGLTDYSKETIQILKMSGFVKAFTTTNKHYYSNFEFEIPRKCIFENDMTSFINKVNG